MKKWYFIGDSHLQCIKYAASLNLINRPSEFNSIAGATAVGLRNPNSMLNALNIFKKSLIPPCQNWVPVIQLGEVDCGFVIWYRAEKYNESVEKQLNESLTSQFSFVDMLTENGYDQVVITSPILPTILDKNEVSEVSNARSSISATLRQRTDLTLEYIERLNQGCALRNLDFIDLSVDLLDPITKVIRDEYRHPNPKDHHLNPRSGSKLWSKHLNSISANDD